MCGRTSRVFSLLFIIGLLASCGGGGNETSSVSSRGISSSSSSTSSHSSSSASSSENIITQCEISNFEDGETISYKLPILNGQCPVSESTVNVEVAGTTYVWPVIDSYFKGAVLLDRGSNEIFLTTADKVSSRTLHYEPSDNPKKVQIVYAIAANDDGHYLAAPGAVNDLDSAKERMIMQGLMLQSAMAEMMYKATGNHQTYTLVEDDNGMPVIDIFEASQTREVLYLMDGLDIYYSIQDLLNTEAQNMNKYLVVMGFSGYANGKMLAHTALGGGNLALMGGSHLHTCPQTVDEIHASFSNTTRIDTSILPDDSVNRGTYWANCATGMGASLHELGHAFGLPHTDYGIMARGFDMFNRLFMITEPGMPGPIKQIDEFDALWHPGSLTILFYSPWIND